MHEMGEQINVGGSRYPDMTYEEGVEATIRWLLGAHHPYKGEAPFRRHTNRKKGSKPK